MPDYVWHINMDFYYSYVLNLQLPFLFYQIYIESLYAWKMPTMVAIEICKNLLLSIEDM